ncbi:Aminopeptidase N [Orchesella cincta]|uniref:Aminopeptidase n=1 Tax=Orchesella cincta TaxID=48709 RepID=A0A1D2MST0_ORCCI|nr:Aminopeptidase N [Orchesella cincta]
MHIKIFCSLVLLCTTSIKVSTAVTPLQLTRDGAAPTSPQEDFLKVIRVPSPKFRLPNDVLPFHYDLRLRPRLTATDPNDGPQWTAPGQVTILVTCVQTTRNISLHSTVREINESSVTITNIQTGLTIAVETHSYVPEKDFYVITLTSAMQIGQRYSIFIDYVADVFTNRLDGLYRSHYDDPASGETKWAATTQFQAFGARAAYPCFDEPGLKATFNITLGREHNFSAVANTPIIDTLPIDGLDNWFWDIFKQTVPMPTYLVALVISDYAFAEASSDLYNKPTRTYAPKHLIDQGHGDFAAMVAAKDLAFFEEFFDYEYALDKMDSAAMWDFAAGAMENWGINIYREVLILYAPNQNNERERRQVSQTLAHELAHQWFGNLVTCAWWTGAWLNEGFASWIQYLGLNHTDPEFESLKTILNDAMQNAMRSDVLANSHPTLLPDKGNPYDTMSYSGNLVYSKGAALIRMMENFLTIGTLQAGLRTYLKRNAFGAVEQDDLFEALTEHALADNRLPEGVTMKTIMDTWTLQKAYPLLKVRHSTSDNIVTITQEEDQGTFGKRPIQSGTNQENPLWFVPMAVSTQSNPQPDNTIPQYWLSTSEMTIPHNSSEWLIVNSGATGYYRVEYDAVLTQRLHDQILRDFTVLNYGTRSQLLDDYFTRAFTGNQQISAALGFTRHLEQELEYVVWAPFFYHMAKPYRLFSGTEVFDSMKEYILPKISDVMDSLQTTRNISFGIDNILYAQLFDWSCGMGNPSCVNQSLAFFETWKSNPDVNPIDPMLRPIVYCTAIANRIDNFQFALERFAASTGTQQTQLLTALGCTTNNASVALLLGAADGSTSQISRQFALAALQSVAANHLHRGTLESFIRNSIEDVVEYVGNAAIIANTLRSLSSYYSSARELLFVNDLAAQYSDLLGAPGVTEIVEAAITAIEDNILWTARFREQFHIWFQQN